jgi:two-component system, NtrC family, response regulator
MQAHHADRLLGRSDAVRRVLEDIGYAAATDAKVLITGESGVGKEIAAHLVHAGGRLAARPFVTLNCAGVPETLLESELFGHTRGSFTGAWRDRAGLLEMANGGTLFMDEVGEMSLRMQALLLRFLETGEIQRIGSDGRQGVVNVRLITATNRDLLQQIRAGAFREDLYYRLNVIHIAISPLRTRREDVPALAEAFLARYAADYKTPPPELSLEALECLITYDWPGNVRELRNVIERLVVRVRGRAVTPADLSDEITRTPPALAGGSPQLARADSLYDRMVHGHESFWSVVYDPFMERDLTREDVRTLITRGLHETRGNYVMLVRLFNMETKDYKRFLNVLHKHGCHLPVAPFRGGAIRRPLPAQLPQTLDTLRSA